MQTHHSASSVQVLSPVENQTGIPSTNAIVNRYRQLGVTSYQGVNSWTF